MNTANEGEDNSTIKEWFIETDYIYYLKNQGKEAEEDGSVSKAAEIPS